MAGIFDQAAAQFSNRMLNGQSELIPKTLGGRIDSTIQNSWDGEAMANIINEGGKGGNMIFDTLANQAEQEKVANALKKREDRIYGDKLRINYEIEKGMTELYGDDFRNSGHSQYITDENGMTNDQIVDAFRTPQMNPLTGKMEHRTLTHSQQDALENNASNYLTHDIMKNSNGQIKSLDDAKNLMERAARGDIDPRVVMLQQNMGQEKFAKVSQLVGAMSENKRLTEMARSSVLDEKDQNEINTWNQLHNRKSIAAAKSRGAEEAKLEHEMVSKQELSRQAQMLPELAVEAEAKKEQMMMALELIKAGKSPAEAKIIASQYMNARGGSSNFMGSGQGQGSGNGSGSGFMPGLGSGGYGSGQGSGSGDYDFGLKGDGTPTETSTNTDGTPVVQQGQGYNGTDLNLSGIRTRQGFDPNDYEASYNSLPSSSKRSYDKAVSEAELAKQSGADPQYIRELENKAAYILATGKENPLRKSGYYQIHLGVNDDGTYNLKNFKPNYFVNDPFMRESLSPNTLKRLENLSRQEEPHKSHKKEMEEVQKLVHNELYEPNRFNKPIEQTQQQVTQQSNNQSGYYTTNKEVLSGLEELRNSGGNKIEIMSKIPSESRQSVLNYVKDKWLDSAVKGNKKATQSIRAVVNYYREQDKLSKTQDAELDKLSQLIDTKTGYKNSNEQYSVTESDRGVKTGLGIYDPSTFKGDDNKIREAEVIRGFAGGEKALNDAIKKHNITWSGKPEEDFKEFGGSIDKFLKENPNVNEALSVAFPTNGSFKISKHLQEKIDALGYDVNSITPEYARRLTLSIMYFNKGQKPTQTNIDKALIKSINHLTGLKKKQMNSGK